MLQFFVIAFVIGFVGIIGLGHALLVQAIFTTKAATEAFDRRAARVGPLVEA